MNLTKFAKNKKMKVYLYMTAVFTVALLFVIPILILSVIKYLVDKGEKALGHLIEILDERWNEEIERKNEIQSRH